MPRDSHIVRGHSVSWEHVCGVTASDLPLGLGATQVLPGTKAWGVQNN